MINDATMEFDVCPTHRKNGSKSNCAAVKSGCDIQLTALEGQLQKAEKKCHSMKKHLDYMKMLYESSGPTTNDIGSPRSVQVKSPTITKIHVLDDLENDMTLFNNETEISHVPEVEKIENNDNAEGQVDKLSEELILNNWSQKSLHQVYSISDGRLFDYPSKSKILECLPKEPEVVLKLTGRSASARDKVQPRILYSASQGDKSDLQRRDELPLRIIRKKRRKLKRSSSKSTTTSKHAAVLPEIKHTRKVWKRRVHRVEEPPLIDASFNEKKKLTNKNDREVVEIYHNTAVQSVQSFSESSSKQCLKMPPQVAVDDVVQNVKNQSKNPNPKITSEVKNNIPSSDKKITEEKSQNIIFRRKQEIKTKDGYGDGQPGAVGTWCNNSFDLPNYQQPTCASKLKRANRCYFSASFNLRNIPFVVGTSITPSHNIGLNIQQVLSLMKTKQPGLATEMRPFFIKKVGKGLNPTIDVEYSVSQHPLEKIDTKIELRNADQEEKQFECKIPKSFSGITSNSAEIRNVMMRLHCQFEQMQTKYEKLQEQASKSNDEKLLKAVNELEDELNAKESEISAVVGLYNEVMALKSQIHGSHYKRNSLVCIAEDYTEKIPSRIQPMNSVNYQRQRMPMCAIRSPSTSTRLTGLLRQIQSFQHQLISS